MRVQGAEYITYKTQARGANDHQPFYLVLSPIVLLASTVKWIFSIRILTPSWVVTRQQANNDYGPKVHPYHRDTNRERTLFFQVGRTLTLLSKKVAFRI